MLTLQRITQPFDKMNTTKKNSKLELLVITVFIILFSSWAVSKCSDKKQELRDKMAAEASEDRARDSIELAAQMAKQAPKKENPPTPTTAENPVNEKGTILFVVTEELNLRAEPNIKSTLIAKLSLHDELIFLNEVTDFKNEFAIEGKTYNEPWVKVKNNKGQTGWVFGAGVHYFKTRR
jgi:hypothetical protein